MVANRDASSDKIDVTQVERRAVVGLLQQIEAERRGDTVDRVLLGHVLRSLTSLGFYQTAFQTPFLQQTTEFYAAEGLQLMATSDVPDYLKHAEVLSLTPPWVHAQCPGPSPTQTVC